MRRIEKNNEARAPLRSLLRTSKSEIKSGRQHCAKHSRHGHLSKKEICY